MQDVLKAAMGMHQAGDLGQAGPLYQKVLARSRRTPRRCICSACCTIKRGITTRRRDDQPSGGSAAQRGGVPREPGRGLPCAGPVRSGRRLLQGGSAIGAELSRGAEQPGLAYQGLGRSTEAIDQFRRALELRPDFAPRTTIWASSSASSTSRTRPWNISAVRSSWTRLTPRP